MNDKVKKILKEYFWVTIGVMLIALAFSFFLDPYNLVIGGVAGIAVILRNVTGWDSSIFLFGINAILLVIGYFFLGRDFLIKTIYGTLTYPLFAYLFELLYKQLAKLNGSAVLIDNSQMLLITLFSAIIMGFGLGIVVKHGATTGGTEVFQNIVYKFWKLPYSISMFMFDGTVVLIGFFVVRGDGGKFLFEFLLYEIMFIYLSGLVMDQIVFSGFNKRAVMIISEKCDEIKERVLIDFERGVTEVDVTGGYTGVKRKQLICVLSTNQFSKLKVILNEVDPKAFYYVMRASEVGGEGFSYE